MHSIEIVEISATRMGDPTAVELRGGVRAEAAEAAMGFAEAAMPRFAGSAVPGIADAAMPGVNEAMPASPNQLCRTPR
ncbi:hypothetical protein DMA15_02385 [Streptomyces sp. WAC 01529]|uniref:hypothetical protein n=1 Tax=Streptomyces sp. WAC 01529 TaxID=2203205 RepID=UPI000F6F4F86|nr:hypothetical protein [Streptomyces sp. WAC 01529]AZM51571.1 hypothetical protein DMA15_02385 [Streptomyces sp. WAC 01529]